MSLSSELEAMHKNLSLLQAFQVAFMFGCIMSRGLPGGLILGIARKPGIGRTLACLSVFNLHASQRGRKTRWAICHICVGLLSPNAQDR